MKHSAIWTLTTFALAFSLSIPAWTADAPKLSAEARQKMADSHQKMADCLKSERPIDECHAEMRKACEETMGESGCPMMGHPGKHPMRRGKMKPSQTP
jgi:hypothetical protein